MTDTLEPNTEVQFFAPDKSLLAKIGVARLDEIFTPGTIIAAQTVIDNSVDEFAIESHGDLAELEKIFRSLCDGSLKEAKPFAALVAAAFSMKSKAGLAGYDLVLALAKSLYLYCEAVIDQPVVQKTCDVIEWHIVTIRQMMKMNIKGTGGETGSAIMAELEKLAAKQSS